ncbi:hypothetical protein ABIF97_008199 [Bradyrhizobium japonicum]
MDRPDSRISCNDRERYADGLCLSAICALGELKAASSSHRDVTPDASLKFAFEQREFAFPFLIILVRKNSRNRPMGDRRSSR